MTIAIILAFQFVRVTISRGQDARHALATAIISSCVRDIRGVSLETGKRCECFRDAVMPLINDAEIQDFGGTTLPPQMAEKAKIAASLCSVK